MPASLAPVVSNAHSPAISVSGYQSPGGSGDSKTRQNVHSFQANMTRIGSSHNLKWGFDHRRMVRKTIEGWHLNWVSTFMSGQPLAVTSNVNTTGSLGGGQRPDSTGSSPARSGPSRDRLERYFDTSPFRAGAPFPLGNLSRRLPDVRGPGLHNWDISLVKNVFLTEKIRVQSRAEAFNAMNLFSDQLD